MIVIGPDGLPFDDGSGSGSPVEATPFYSIATGSSYVSTDGPVLSSSAYPANYPKPAAPPATSGATSSLAVIAGAVGVVLLLGLVLGGRR